MTLTSRVARRPGNIHVGRKRRQARRSRRRRSGGRSGRRLGFDRSATASSRAGPSRSRRPVATCHGRPPGSQLGLHSGKVRLWVAVDQGRGDNPTSARANAVPRPIPRPAPVIEGDGGFPGRSTHENTFPTMGACSAWAGSASVDSRNSRTAPGKSFGVFSSGARCWAWGTITFRQFGEVLGEVVRRSRGTATRHRRLSGPAASRRGSPRFSQSRLGLRIVAAGRVAEAEEPTRSSGGRPTCGA